MEDSIEDFKNKKLKWYIKNEKFIEPNDFKLNSLILKELIDRSEETFFLMAVCEYDSSSSKMIEIYESIENHKYKLYIIDVDQNEHDLLVVESIPSIFFWNKGSFLKISEGL